jgi:hypothetical protein
MHCLGLYSVWLEAAYMGLATRNAGGWAQSLIRNTSPLCPCDSAHKDLDPCQLSTTSAPKFDVPSSIRYILHPPTLSLIEVSKLT